MIDVAVIPEMTADRRMLMPCASIRLFLPLTNAEALQVLRPTFISSEEIEYARASVVIAHRLSITSLAEVEKVVRYCEREGCKLIYDLDDDLLALGPDHTQSDAFASFKPVVRGMLAAADQTWVSTQVLAHRLASQTKRVVVVPNGLDSRLWRVPSSFRGDGETIRFMYMGTPTHRQDFLSVVRPAFERLQREFKGRVSLTVIGVTDEVNVGAFYSVVRPPSALSTCYPGFVAWLQAMQPHDVGLAPLVATEFNVAKSNIKQLEYSALGMATIAANLPPYQAVGGPEQATILADPTPDAFLKAMRMLVADAFVRNELKRAASEFVADYLRRDHDDPRISIIQDLCGIPPSQQKLTPSIDQSTAAVSLRHDEYIPPLDPGEIATGVRCVALYYLDHAASRIWSIAEHMAAINLAKSYGIKGFCYCTSGAGLELLAEEVSSIDNGTMDGFQMCVCWNLQAVSDQVMAASDPSTYFDTSVETFAKRIAPLLRRPNYLRINGRTVLVVEGLHLVPNAVAVAVARQWRAFCLQEKIGELFLVTTLSTASESVLLEFDAVVDFTSGRESFICTESYKNQLARSYRQLVLQSYTEVASQHLCLPCVSAGIATVENGVRQGTPAAYQEWLENACRLAVRAENADAPLVFIDGWADSPAGSFLLPDGRYGHAYLNATAKALQSNVSTAPPRLAVIAHVFYEDLWPEIADRLSEWQLPFDLYVSVPAERADRLSAVVAKAYPGASISCGPNRGRDIAPFVTQAKLAMLRGNDIICKVHTKRSEHRADGHEWRTDLYNKLLRNPNTVLEAFSANAALGIIGAEGHVIPAEFYWGANKARVYELAQTIGYPGSPEPFMFVAGSMFWIRSKALDPILQLDLGPQAFEEEQNQVDGTLAHALERLFPIAARLGGYRLVDTRVLSNQPRVGDRLRSDAELACYQQRLPNYPFAPASHGILRVL